MKSAVSMQKSNCHIRQLWNNVNGNA